MVKVVSLFSGCGGLDLGFKWAGYNIIWANDIMSDSCETYSKNIGNHITCRNILDINTKDIPQADLVLGGPPCQAFSLVGRRDPHDSRATLVWAYLEAIRSIKPKIFLFENVTGIKSAKAVDGSSVIDNLSIAFEQMGYTLSITTLNSADFGVPQRRKRVFIVGNLQSEQIPPPEKKDSWLSSSDALSDLPLPVKWGTVVRYDTPPKNDYQQVMRQNSKEITHHWIQQSSSKDLEIISHVTPGGNYMDVPDEIATKRILNFKKTGGRTTTYGRLSPKSPAYTINTHFNRPNVGCNIHYCEDRLITIREALRLQSFPDNFVLHSTNKRNYFVQVGNAVPPNLSHAWAIRLKEYLSDF